MLSFEDKPTYFCCGFTDMLKSIKGLSMLVRVSFSMAPDSNTIFVFCNKRRDRLKILEWDGHNFWVYFTHQAHGHFPWSVDGTKALCVTVEELMTLINGVKLVNKIKGKDAPTQFLV